MIRVFVDDVACVADAEQSVTIDYRATDLADVESGREGLHVRLQLPATAENGRIFGNPEDLASAERFNDEYHVARVEADGVEIFRGTAYLAGVEIDGVATWYRLEIVGGASLWAKQSAKKMFNLIGVDYDATLDMNEICESWQSDSPVKFLPVHRDRYELQNGVTTSFTPEKILTTDDYHPFLSVAALVGAIFAKAGYRVESRFFDSDLFRSLYVSGAYPTTDITARAEKMDFKAGRLDSVTATANYAGRVYVSPVVAANSLGNIVDTVAEVTTDDNGNEISTGFYSKNGCFALDENGCITFTPLSAVKVGFEYVLKFACGYRIATRSTLESFDHIYFGDGITIPLSLANRYVDYRENPIANFEYRIVIFDYLSEYDYRLRCKVNGAWENVADITSRTALVRTPRSTTGITAIELLRAEVGSGVYEPCTEDWALYGGYVAYEDTTEVEMTLRTPAVEVTPTSPKRFDSIYFGGGEFGREITLLPGTTLRPIFTATLGYGSRLSFADVAQISVRQNTLLDAVRHMFDLRFYTDERRKTVYVEPYGDFVKSDEVFDWSNRVDFAQPIIIEEQVRNVRERRTLAYNEDDGTIRRYNGDEGVPFGEWSFDVASRASVEGEERLQNPMFTPTISADGKYANAESALIMQVSDRDAVEVDDGANFSPRIVRYVGLHPLPANERWGFPYGGNDYPLAAFHFAGDEHLEGFTLCFEDRDGVTGLHSYYDRRFAEEARGHKLTLSIRMSAEDFDHLFHFVDGAASIRSTFVLNINGVKGRYTLSAIDGYDPSKSSVRCVFLQTASMYE